MLKVKDTLRATVHLTAAPDHVHLFDPNTSERLN